jgi:hypothetical protein
MNTNKATACLYVPFKCGRLKLIKHITRGAHKYDCSVILKTVVIKISRIRCGVNLEIVL